MKTYLPVEPGARRSFRNTRPVYVVDNLRDLNGPRSGNVTLPLHLDWTPSATYDFADPRRVRTMYATVLREAAHEGDLTAYLNSDVLVAIWGSLNISAFVRASWETAHPELR